MKKLSLVSRLCISLGLIALQFIAVEVSAQTSYRIIDRWKNNVLCDTGANAAYQPTSTGTHCQWQIIDVSGYKSFRNLATNDYLHIENLTGTVQAAGGDSSWWSAQWTLETIDSTYSWIRNRWQSGQYLHVENQTGFAQSGSIDKNWWSSQWRFEAVSGPASSSLPSSSQSSIAPSSIPSSSSSSSSSSVNAIVKLYQHCNYGGWLANFGMGSFDVNQIIAAGGLNDDASSLQIAPGYQVTLFQNAGFSGTSIVLTGNVPCLVTQNFNDVLSSMIVSPISNSSSSNTPISSSSVPASSSAGSSSSVGATVAYQAENNFYSGGVTNAGTYLQNFAATGARVIFSTNLLSAGTFAVDLSYGNGSGSAKTLNIYVNGLLAKTTTLQPTGGNITWGHQIEQLTLRSGFNTISYQYDSGNTGGVNIDCIAVTNATALATRGATLAYQEYEAENGTTNGQVSAYGISFPSVESESSGRRFVNLTAQGHYVQWTAQKAANALVVRYNMPEAPNGGGTTGTLSVYVNGTKVKTLNLTSRYAYTYGGWPFDNDNPSGGTGHHFFDESRVTGLNIPVGATVKLQRDSGDTAPFYKIDLIDLEQIDNPYSMPANFVSVTTYGGAVANDGIDDTQAIINTINYAKQMGMGVWIPAGTFNTNSKLDNLSNVHIRGAGMWYTTIQGSNGQGGVMVTGGHVTLADMQFTSDSIFRNNCCDAAGIEGNFGTGSLVQNVWIEHMKVGVWLKPGTDGLYLVNGRIRDTWADGVNFHAGVINSMISHFNVRNTGDDNMAMWSPAGQINVNNTFRFNTAQIPVLSNNFAIYGGQDNKILDNIGEDNVRASAGIAISTRNFESTTSTFSGTTEVRRNTLNRTGGWEPNWNSAIGALWIFADGKQITSPVIIDTLSINNSSYDALLMSDGQVINNLTVSNVQINGAGGYGIRTLGVTGSGNFSYVTVTGAASGGLSNSTYTFVRGAGNSGW